MFWERHSAAIAKWDIAVANNPEAESLFKAAPGGVRTTQAFSQSNRYKELDTDRAKGVIRSKEHAFSQDGGLAVLFGNIAEDGPSSTREKLLIL